MPAIEAATLNLGYTEIRAPFAGRLGRNQAAKGALVGPASGPLNIVVAGLDERTGLTRRQQQLLHVGANTGELVIPAALPAGKYRLNVTAEDIAHNIGTGEVSLEILP